MDSVELMGKRVKFSKSFSRAYRGAHRAWEPVDRPGTGWIVGFRTIQNGYVDWDTSEYGVRESGNYFVPDGYIKCVLVATTPHNTPFRVPMDAFELLD